ncbi:MAG: hypothetical protein GY772_25315 [bacterium]|nr:hypothetical protein [bacterium]
MEEIQKRLIEHRFFERWFLELKIAAMAALAHVPRDTPVVLVFFCNSGRHRSVGCAEVLHTILEHCGWVALVTGLVHMYLPNHVRA